MEYYELEFLNKLKEKNINLDNNKLSAFDKYYNLTISYNQKVNLTAILDRFDFYYKHFFDSIIPCKLYKDNSSIIDIGAGAGFPSIPLKIENSTLNITMLDALNKRVNFLNETIELLELTNICAIHERAEILSKQIEYREKFDYAISRAVAQLNILVELSLPFVKIGGFMYAYKGSNTNDELNNAKNTITKLGGKIEKVINYALPFDLGERNLIIIKKISPTPIKFPRTMSQIKSIKL